MKRIIDIEAHIVNAPIHPRIVSGAGMPALLENHTFRGNASDLAEDTDSVLIYDGDGATTTDDHTVGLDDRFPPLIYINVGDAFPTASNYPIGTLLCVK